MVKKLVVLDCNTSKLLGKIEKKEDDVILKSIEVSDVWFTLILAKENLNKISN